MKHRSTVALLFIISAGILSLSPAISQTLPDSCDLSQLFVEANQLYNQGNYNEARDRYEQITAMVQNGALSYNLGNTYLKIGEIGRAIHSYRNALLYTPRDPDLKANLAYARSHTKDQLGKSSRLSILSSLCFWYEALNFPELLLLLTILNALFWAVALLRIWFRNEFLYWSFMATLILLLVAGGTWGVKAYQTFMSQEAVVTGAELPVRSGNDLKSTVLFYLHDGAEVAVIARNNHWIKIQLPDGKKGWIQEAFVGIVGEV
jgi:tetratricopeptide (TPR) repeat protein